MEKGEIKAGKLPHSRIFFVLVSGAHQPVLSHWDHSAIYLLTAKNHPSHWRGSGSQAGLLPSVHHCLQPLLLPAVIPAAGMKQLKIRDLSSQNESLGSFGKMLNAKLEN